MSVCNTFLDTVWIVELLALPVLVLLGVRGERYRFLD